LTAIVRETRSTGGGRPALIFECVPNVSEGRDETIVEACAAAIQATGATLAHRTSDPAHHRSVFTFFGTRGRVVDAALALAAVTTERIDLRRHRGEHPRIGALDVLPFVPFGDATLEDAACVARDVATRLWDELSLPTYFYGAAASNGTRLLADVRTGGFEGLGTRPDTPDVGSGSHLSAGAVAVGARPPLVAFNVILASDDLALARGIARSLRERDGGLRTLRALGIRQHDGRVQVSFNVTDPNATPLDRIVALVAALARPHGVTVAGSELIGLIPRAVLEAVVDRSFAGRHS
jgi:glutamate formiminotransferase